MRRDGRCLHILIDTSARYPLEEKVVWGRTFSRLREVDRYIRYARGPRQSVRGILEVRKNEDDECPHHDHAVPAQKRVNERFAE